jgi:hypothetical protein
MKMINNSELIIIFLHDLFLPTFPSIVHEYRKKTAYFLVRVPNIFSSAHTYKYIGDKNTTCIIIGKASTCIINMPCPGSVRDGGKVITNQKCGQTFLLLFHFHHDGLIIIDIV